MKALFFVRDFNVNNFIKLSEYYESLTSKYFVSESDLNIKNYKIMFTEISIVIYWRQVIVVF